MNKLLNMKRSLALTGLFFILVLLNVQAQNLHEFSKIDLLIIRGENYKVIDTCRQILKTDSLNSEIWYKMGLALQNLMSEENSFSCFSKASEYHQPITGTPSWLQKAFTQRGNQPLPSHTC